MRMVQRRILAAAALSLLGVAAAGLPIGSADAQASAATAQAKKVKKVLTPEEKAAADLEKAVKRAKAANAMFASTEPLNMTLTTNIKRIRNDKKDKAPWRPATFSYVDAAGKPVTIPAQIRTRGIWRLKNCEFPPIRINLKSEVTKGTLLQGIDKPKLVSYCHDTDEFEQYVLQELQLYRIYNLLTPASHRVRLLRLAYVDSASGKIEATRAAMFLEEPEIMAARLGGPLMELKGAVAEDLEPFHGALSTVFQYFIGNTDFSIYALHNMELVNQPSGQVIAVPYDFDFSGAVNANYATTDPKLSIRRVRDRLFRGYCQSPNDYTLAFAKFNEKKNDIYALYTDPIGKMLKPKIVEETLRYYDEFYKIINDPKKAKREIVEECVPTK